MALFTLELLPASLARKQVLADSADLDGEDQLRVIALIRQAIANKQLQAVVRNITPATRAFLLSKQYTFTDALNQVDGSRTYTICF